MNSANKKVEKLMSLFPKTIGNQRFFLCFVSDPGSNGSSLPRIPHLPGTTSGRRERERARVRRAMALSGTRFQGTEGADRP